MTAKLDTFNELESQVINFENNVTIEDLHIYRIIDDELTHQEGLFKALRGDNIHPPLANHQNRLLHLRERLEANRLRRK